MAEQFKIPEISYTSRDYASIVDDQLKAIPFFAPEWTDHNQSDFGIAMLQMNAYIADVIHFYIDRQAKEGYLPTALKRESVRDLLKLINYELGSSVPASVDVVFSMPLVLTGDLLIPKGTELQTVSDNGGSPIFFETADDLTILSGSLTGTIGAIEGQTKTEFLDDSDGTILQKRVVSFFYVVDNSVQIFIDEGAGEVEWTKVETLAFSEGTDLHYVVTKKGSPEQIVIEFGDNNQGRIPVSGSQIKFVGRILTEGRGGINGNVGATVINVINDTITFLGDVVSLSITNPLSASGGEPEESIESAKINGPKSLKALNRAVTEEDYKILSLAFDGVALANAFTSQGVCCCNIEVVIYPEGGGIASSVLKEDLLTCLNEKKMAGTCVEITDAIEVPINIEGVIYLRDNFLQDDASECVNEHINDFFNIKIGPLDIGIGINVSDVYPLITECFDFGVKHVDLSVLTTQPIANYEVWSGNTIFEFITPKSESVQEKWTITFISQTQFSVNGSISGLQSTIGIVGQDYKTDNQNSLVFKIIPDPNIPTPSQNNVGDHASFSTSKIFGNIELDKKSVAIKGTVSFSYVGGTKRKIKC